MLRLYRVMGDNRIMVCALARALGLKDPKNLRRKLRENEKFTSFQRCTIEGKFKQAGIRWTESLWDSEPDFVHPFFAKEALVAGPTKRSGVERLPGFEETRGDMQASPRERIIDFRKEVAPMATMLGEAVLRKFRLEKDPFVNELMDGSDVFMSREHKRAEWLLLDAAGHQHFVALVGPVGSGKTIVLKRVMEKMDPKRDPSFAVSSLRCLDKEEATSYSIMEALIKDFSSETPLRSREGRARQIGSLLVKMVNNRQKPVLIIDEAHALNYRTLRALKRLFDETEMGFRQIGRAHV